MRAFAAIFETDGRQVASYALTAESSEAALALLDGVPWPDEATWLRILDEEGREVLEVGPPAMWP